MVSKGIETGGIMPRCERSSRDLDRPAPSAAARDGGGLRTRAIGVALLAGLLAAGSLWSRESTPRPRIGLALSGGGARGVAHIGVLKVLEENHIPIDYVAGTSMGAIVGGLYSAGISPEEMEKILADVDWRALFNDRPDRRSIPYRRKVDDQTFLTRFEVGFNHGAFQLPSGLITGQELGFALQVLALRTAGIDDFDNLPIPFRAVATDVETGDMVVLDHGDLGHAIRASMSIPAVFSPVEIDGRLLVDGGLARNLPVDVVRSMGADIVIAVDVGEATLDKAALNSISKLASQVIGLQIRKNVDQQAANADILIKPDLGDFSSTDFEHAIELVPIGEQAARAVEDKLRTLSIPVADYTAYIDRVRRPTPPPRRVSSVQVTGSSSTDPQFVFSKIKTRPGSTFDLKQIQKDIRRLYETGDYESVGFFLSKLDDGYALNIETRDKPWGPDYLRFGMNLEADLEGESSFNLLASYTMTRLNRLRGEFKVIAQLGEDPTASVEFYQPLSRAQTWFVAPWASQSTTTTYTAVSDSLLARYRADQLQGGVDLGLQMGKLGELRLGVFGGTGHADLQHRTRTWKVDDPVDSYDLDAGGYRFIATIDQFDNMNFPRRGFFGYLGYYHASEALGSRDDFDLVRSFLGAAATRGRHTGLALVNLYTDLGSSAPTQESLGGLFNLSGYEPNSIVGVYGGKVALLYLFRLAQLSPAIGDGVYAGVSLEAGNLWMEQSQVSTSDLLYSGSLVVGVDTALGPLYLAQGFTEHGIGAAYLFLGRSF